VGPSRFGGMAYGHAHDQGGTTIGKHRDKVVAALARRIASTPNERGFTKPGSMNKRKTGYAARKAR
jgi:hypothetical protein